MEKLEDTKEEKNYEIKKDVVWRTSLNEGNLPFTHPKPSLKELSQDELKKLDLPELTEANIFKSFKAKAAPIFNKGNLVYNHKEGNFYKVVDLKTDDDYKPTWASLSSKDGKDSKEISTQKEFDEYHNYLQIYVNINREGTDTVTLEVSPKIYDKFEISFDSPFQGAGVQLMGYKLFFNGKEIQKDQSISAIDDIKEGDTIYASEGFGKPFKFNRFPNVYKAYGWSNSGYSPDGIAFIPNQHIKVCGFSTFAARSKDSYEMKYRVRINGSDMEEEQIVAIGWEDEYYYRHRLNGVYDAPPGSKIEFTCWIAENLSSKQYVETYYGDGGYDYEKVENEHMGLFKVESGGDSGNGTSVYSGHFGEIFYYLS